MGSRSPERAAELSQNVLKFFQYVVVAGKDKVAPPESYCAHCDAGIIAAVDNCDGISPGEMRVTLPVHF